MRTPRGIDSGVLNGPEWPKLTKIFLFSLLSNSLFKQVFILVELIKCGDHCIAGTCQATRTGRVIDLMLPGKYCIGNFELAISIRRKNILSFAQAVFAAYNTQLRIFSDFWMKVRFVF